ncbi:unnamed protein product [Camellia sinensis]
MGRFVLACLVLAQILLVQAMAIRSDGSELNPPTVVVRTSDESHPAAVDHAIADPPSSSESASEGEAQAPEIRRLGKHHSPDKSVAGGGVIIGGLVTAIFAAVYCYIRVTRRKDGEEKH